jgi:hypothetical protein
MAADETFNQLNETDNESTKILERVNYYVCIPQ